MGGGARARGPRRRVGVRERRAARRPRRLDRRGHDPRTAWRWTPRSGLHLIELAHQQHGLAYAFGNGGLAICQLAGVGPGGSDCFAEYPNFWGYWHGSGSGAWTWASTGAGSARIGDGDLDAWVWGSGDTAATHPARPRLGLDDVCTPAPPPSPSSSPAATGRPRRRARVRARYRHRRHRRGRGAGRRSRRAPRALGHSVAVAKRRRRKVVVAAGGLAAPPTGGAGPPPASCSPASSPPRSSRAGCTACAVAPPAGCGAVSTRARAGIHPAAWMAWILRGLARDVHHDRSLLPPLLWATAWFVYPTHRVAGPTARSFRLFAIAGVVAVVLRTALVLFRRSGRRDVAFAPLEGLRLATLLVLFGTFNAVTDRSGWCALPPALPRAGARRGARTVDRAADDRRSSGVSGRPSGCAGSAVAGCAPCRRSPSRCSRPVWRRPGPSPRAWTRAATAGDANALPPAALDRRARSRSQPPRRCGRRVRRRVGRRRGRCILRPAAGAPAPGPRSSRRSPARRSGLRPAARTRVSEALRYDDVSFTYPERRRPALAT